MIYLTFGDSPGGVLFSQAIDVCKFISMKFGIRIRMVFFISLRGFWIDRKKLKNVAPGCIVLPMFPKINSWRLNGITLAVICLLTGRKSIMARGVLATNLALFMYKLKLARKVCYDGRGAYNAEWHEYNIAASNQLINEIHTLESNAVNKSQFRLAVSNQLVLYWNQQFQYSSLNHIVVPCLLDTNFKRPDISEEIILSHKYDHGYSPDDVVLIYSGSTAGWQSFSLLENFLAPLLKSNSKYKVLFLSRHDDKIESLKSKFPQQVNSKWVNHSDVSGILLSGDYGILIREDSITNKVASPTKFAEYLSAGLNILISENLGDYSAFVRENKCGLVVKDNKELLLLEQNTLSARKKNIGLVENNFTKQSQTEKYKLLVKALA